MCLMMIRNALYISGCDLKETYLLKSFSGPSATTLLVQDFSTVVCCAVSALDVANFASLFL